MPKEAKEAQVAIDGFELSSAQSMALRVAVSTMLSELGDEEYRRGLGDIAELYQACLGEVQELLLVSTNR